MSATRTLSLIILCLCVSACSEGRSPEQAFEELRVAVLADDFESVVRLLPERIRTKRLADLESRISEWRNDAEALAAVASATGMTSEQILGQPRLWVLSRIYRIYMLPMTGAFKNGSVVGIDYSSDDVASVRVELPGVPIPVDIRFERVGAKWCWSWDHVPDLDPAGNG